jgi:hypothetical protein
MNRYQPATPRAPIMIAAVAMSALSLALSVLPASWVSGGHETRLEAAASASAPAAGGMGGEATPIVVYGVREQKTAFEPVRHNPPPRGEAG